MKNKPVLITGATGYLGSNLTQTFILKGIPVVCLVRPGSEVKLDKKLKESVSLLSSESDIECLAQAFSDLDIQSVLHLATYFVAEHSPLDIPALLQSNIQLGVKIAEAAALANVKKFLNIGTFWQHHQGKLYSPTSLYASTKKAFEDILYYYSECRGISVVNLKFGAVYGPDDPREKLINLLLRSAAENKTLALSGGEQLLDLIYIDDAIQVVFAGLKILNTQELGANESFSVSSKNLVTLRKLVEIVEECTPSKLSVEWGAKPYRHREFFSNWASDAPLPNWVPSVSLQTGLKRIFRDFITDN